MIGLLAAGWILLLGQPTGVSAALRKLFVNLSTPFVKLGDWIPVVRFRRDLARKNEELRLQNEQLRLQVRNLTLQGEENLRLSQLLTLKEHVQPRTLGARVIGRDASNWWKSIQIDRGAQDGLRPNLAVINSDGLVGKIVSVSRGESRVLLIVDASCKASALLKLAREPGIVAGLDTAFNADGICELTFVDRNAKVQVGEDVITSGLGTVFPKGLLIGTVVRAQSPPKSRMYQEFVVKPAIEFRKLEEVLVILE
jgi:rod shape-determining protein MreC